MTFKLAAVALLALGASTAGLLAQTTPAPTTTPSTPPTATQPAPTAPKAPSQTAAPTTPTPDFKTTCGDDVIKLCGTAKKGEVRRCIQANEDKLSAACKTFVTTAREERQKQFKAACATDAKTHCSKETRGDAKVRECLVANQAKLSDSCKGFLSTPRNARLGKEYKAQ